MDELLFYRKIIVRRMSNLTELFATLLESIKVQGNKKSLVIAVEIVKILMKYDVVDYADPRLAMFVSG